MNRRRFAEYPDVAEITMTRKGENQSMLENEEEIKTMRTHLRHAEQRCEHLKHQNKYLKKTNKHLKKRVQHLEEVGGQGDKKIFFGEKILDTVLRVMKGISGFLNALTSIFGVFKRSKVQCGVIA